MYTSFYSKGSSLQKKATKSKASVSDLSMGGVEVNVKPVLEYNAQLSNNKLTVRKILSEKVFIVYHEDFHQDFILKCISEDECITKWIDLPSHTNIVTAFDSFFHDGKQFQLLEYTNGGNMYSYIDSLHLNLGLQVPMSYIELIYDVTIQLAMAIEFAHCNGLVHGMFDLSKIVISKVEENFVFKVTDFKPNMSMNMPLSSEANYWPFAKHKKNLTECEKMEVLMLKDIYSLGICVLEMMIGRISTSKYSISLDSLPLTWAEYQESTPLIQVLVECINIDSISQRKGKLQNVKKILIKEYKKFFKRPFYRMENPFIGKQSDVCNKKAIIALSKGDDQTALELWNESLLMNEHHYDTQANQLLYHWRSGQLTDQEVQNNPIFENKTKGPGFLGQLQIAIGKRDEGIQILNNYLNEEYKECQNEYFLNIKLKRYKNEVKTILDSVQSEKDKYFQNYNVQHEHKEKIDKISFASGSKYFISTSSDKIIIWQFKDQIKKLVEIPIQNQNQVNSKVLACVDPRCSRLIIGGNSMEFKIYEIDMNAKSYKQKEFIDLFKELERQNIKDITHDEFDILTEIRFIDNEQFRIVYQKQKQPYFIDTNINNFSIEVKKAEKFEDKSIFKYGLTYVDQQESLLKFVAKQQQNGNIIVFPEKEFQVLSILNRENKESKYFMIYDIFNSKFIRKIMKNTQNVQDQSDAFDIDQDANVIIYANCDHLVFQSVKIPSGIQKFLTPRYQIATYKQNPAQICSQKQIFLDKLQQNLSNYESLQPNMTKNKDLNLLLMIKKTKQGFKNKKLIQFNEDFLKIQKILLQEKPKNYPIKSIENIVKVTVFDQIQIHHDLNRIKSIEISDSINNNYIVVTIDETVQFYDLSTKNEVLSFKSKCSKNVRLFDKETKLLTASEKEIKLWELSEVKGQLNNDLITVTQTPFAIDQVFVNKTGQQFYYIAVKNNQFIVYHQKLEKLFDGMIPANENIKTIEFSKDNDKFYIGSNLGKIHMYLKGDKKSIDPDPIQIDDGCITILYRIPNEEQTKEYLFVNVSQKGLYLFNTESKEKYKMDISSITDLNSQDCTQLKSSNNGKYIIIGNSQTSKICIYLFNELDHCIQAQQKQPLMLCDLSQVHFSTFQTDKWLSQIVFINPMSRTLELYLIQWDFDVSRVNDKEYQTLDDNVLEEDNESDTLDGKNKFNRLTDGKTKSACCFIF